MKETEHKYVADKTNHHQSFGGCRGIKSDYRTVQCLVCKQIEEYDFATD